MISQPKEAKIVFFIFFLASLRPKIITKKKESSSP